MHTKIQFFFILNLVPFFFFGQGTNEKGFEVKSKIGFLAIQHQSMSHLPKETAKAFEFSYFNQTRGNKLWHKAYRYPTIGATLFIGSVGNTKVLGTYTGIYGFAELPLIKYKKFELNFKFSSGLGYSNLSYYQNPKNVAIGTNWNTMMCFGLKSIQRFKNSTISLGVDLTHFSNGGYKMPNFGINIPYVSIGYGRRIGKKQDYIEKGSSDLPLNKWLYNVFGMYTQNTTRLIGDKRYSVFGTGFSARRYFGQRAGIEFDLDIISKQVIFSYEPSIPKTQLSILQLGLYSAYLVPLNNFNFVLGMGVYFKDTYNFDLPIYFRIGGRYQFLNGLTASYALKTHAGQADYLEFGLGYTFNYK